MRILISIAVVLLLQACKHPLEIVGQGDIVERIAGVRGCTFDDFQAQSTRCTENDVADSDYVVSYAAVAHEGWVFKGWEGTACGGDSIAPYCEYATERSGVDWTNLFFPGFAFPPTIAVFQPVGLVEFEQHIATDILDARCLNCHFEGGVSGHTRLVFDKVESEQQDANNYAVFENFVDEVEGATDLILTKIRGGAGHGGGSIFTSGSDEFMALSTFLSQLDEGGGPGPDPLPGDFWDGITLENPRSTLRRAAIILGGPLPIEADYQLAESGDEGLRQALRALLQGEGFHEFLVSAANDRLLTQALHNLLPFDVLDPNADKLPILAARQYDAHIDGSDEAVAIYYQWADRLRYGASRSPLELIAYVVENDRPYSEILTASFTMVNPQLGEVFRSDALQDSSDATLFAPAFHKGQIFTDDQLVSEYTQDVGLRIDGHSGFFETYPHAGVLNTLAFLARYPTTETNRNRARARWAYLHFLGVDIEKSASRTTDPAALADTDNPTLNNPACTVCHQLHDPVAGTFQNYSNEGWYRSSYGGQDSLPDTYKYPQWFDDNAAPSAYQEGDTWYRDMRTPGLSGQTTNSAGNSVQWLARQIVADDRFAAASVKFWWPAVMGTATLDAPEATGDIDAGQRLAAFEAQSEQIATLADAFRAGIDGGERLILRDLLVEMMMTPWFRADLASGAALEGRSIALEGIGSRRLLTPREMNNKTRALFGRAWGEQSADWKADGIFTELGDTYRVYYGGIDSAGIKDRARQLTSLMRNVAQIQALQMACGKVLLDFNRPDNERLLFQGIDRTTSPLTEFSDTFDVSADDYLTPAVHALSGWLEPGSSRLRMSFINDYYEEDTGNDRNLVIDRIEVHGPDGAIVTSVAAEDLRAVPGFLETDDEWGPRGDVTHNDVGEEDGWMLWSEGFVSIPLAPAVGGTHTITISAWAQQAGPEVARMAVELSGATPWSNTAGERALKEKLVELHERFLGEQRLASDAEIEASYRLLVETWQARLDRGVYSYPDWENEQCSLREEEWDWLNALEGTSQDPSGMMGSWTSVLVYLMSDFRFLHE